jgi:hypothetical protein
MGNVIVWAVLTALITGGVWGGIVFVQRLRRRIAFQEELLDDARHRLAALEEAGNRVVDVENRLDDTERRLMQQREEAGVRHPPKA